MLLIGSRSGHCRKSCYGVGIYLINENLQVVKDKGKKTENSPYPKKKKNKFKNRKKTWGEKRLE